MPRCTESILSRELFCCIRRIILQPVHFTRRRDLESGIGCCPRNLPKLRRRDIAALEQSLDDLVALRT